MAFVSVPNTIEVETVFEIDGQICENTAYFEGIGGAPSLEAVSSFLSDMKSLIETDLLPLLASSVKLVRLVATLLDAVDSFSTILAVSPPSEGGASSEGMPNNVAYCITFLTDLRGRSFRGRNYISGIPIDGALVNTVSGTFRTGVLAYYSALKALSFDDDLRMVVVSRFADHAPRVTGVTTPVTGFTTYDAILDSQRRRLPGRGR